MLGTLSLTRSDLVGVGVGCPGPLRIRDGCIIRTANLPGWNDVPLRDRLHAQFDLPVTLDNDGNAAAYGEFWVGAGRGSEDLVMLTLGTGVGAGVVLGGRLLHGHFDNAAELGHMIVVPDGLPCRCGQRGCLEQYSSAGAVAQRVITAIQAGEPCELADRVQAGNEPNDAARVPTDNPHPDRNPHRDRKGASDQDPAREEPDRHELAPGRVDAALVAECAQRGDSLCLRIWDEACLYLAVACINIQHAFNPACIVLGGGMSQAGAFLMDRVTDHFTRLQWSLHTDYPRIVPAQLGSDAGVIGAAGLVLAHV